MFVTKVPASWRNLPLVASGQTATDKTTLTVETHVKWYDIYGVTPGGRAFALPVALRRRFEAEFPGHVAWSDHVPTPTFCRWLVETFPDRYEWDPVALELVAGRWLVEGRPCPELWRWPAAPPPENTAPDPAGG